MSFVENFTSISPLELTWYSCKECARLIWILDSVCSLLCLYFSRPVVQSLQVCCKAREESISLIFSYYTFLNCSKSFDFLYNFFVCVLLKMCAEVMIGDAWNLLISCRWIVLWKIIAGLLEGHGQLLQSLQLNSLQFLCVLCCSLQHTIWHASSISWFEILLKTSF